MLAVGPSLAGVRPSRLNEQVVPVGGPCRRLLRRVPNLHPLFRGEGRRIDVDPRLGVNAVAV